MPDNTQTDGFSGPPLSKPLVLVGMMGAGKSTVGRRLADRLSLPFTDSDHAIETKAGMQISDIFAARGEPYFRELEIDTIQELLKEPPQVLAVGGGAFVNDSLRSAMNEAAISIWLDAPLDILVERVSRRDTRPLLRGGDKRAILEELLEKRRPAYSQAHIRVETTAGTHAAVVNRILGALEQYLQEPSS